MHLPTRIASCLLALLLGGLATAQDKSAERLRTLLHELANTDASAWAAQKARLEAEVEATVAAAAELRKRASDLQQQATAKDAAVKELQQQIEQLQQLKELAAKLPKPAPMPAAAPAVPTKQQPPPTTPAATDKPAVIQTPPQTPPPAADLVTWDNHVARLFDQHCASCHDPDSKKGGFDVTSFAAMRQGGGSGRTIVPGEPDKSRLLLMISQQERPFMPKNDDPLPKEDVDKVRLWIEQGACEDEASAKAFVAERQKAAAEAVAESSAPASSEAPMPAALPRTALRSAARPGAVKCLARSPKAPLLALPGFGQVLLFDAEMAPLGVLPCPLPHVESVGFSPDGALLFAAGGERGRSGQVVVYDVRSGKQLAICGHDRDTPLGAAVSHKAGLVALGGSSKHARVFSFDGKERFAGKHDDFVLGMDFNADGSLLAVADRSGVVQVWETATGRLGQTLAGHDGAVNAVAFHGNKLLATAGADGTVRAWDATNGKEQWRLAAHQGEAIAVAFGPGDRLASCGNDGRIRVISLGGKALAQSPAAGDWLYGLGFGADGDVVFAGDWQGRVQRFDLKTRKLAAALPFATAQ